MPPLNDQNRGAGASKDGPTEIISPLKVHSPHLGDDRSLRQWIGPAALLLCLVTVLAAGSWFIWYLHKNPMPLATQAEKETPAHHSNEENTGSAQDTAVTTSAAPVEAEASKTAGPQSPGNVYKEEVSNEVLSLMANGQKFEVQKDYASALAAYRQAYDRNPQYEEAGIAVKRVTDKIADAKYRQALATGLEALERKDYDRARKYLLEASSVKPDSREAKKALASLNQTLRRIRIASLKEKGQVSEAVEDWQAARKQYESILSIEAGNEFARQGLSRVQDQMRVLTDIQSYVNQPDKLLVKSSLEKAQAVLKKARSLDPRGPRLSQNISRLEEMVAKALKPVQVIITSDNLTQVDVYRIGRLGRFNEKRLDLKPGVYTVVGHREGYQDVRYEIVIQPGQENQQLTVICKVKV